MKNRLWVVLVLMVGLFVAGCSGSGSKQPKTLTFHLSAEPGNLNPLLYTDVYSGTVCDAVFNGLLKANEDLEIVPDLAESYSVSPDGLTYTFKLKKTVTWHDGKPFTSADVLFTFKTLFDPKTNTVRRSQFIVDGKPIRFSAPDPLTVVATLPKPFAPFLSAMTQAIIPEHLLKTVDVNKAAFNRQPVGTGPFVFVEWKPGQFVTLKRNPHYFGNLAKSETLRFKIIPNTNTTLLALKKGEIDEASDLQPQDFEALQSDRNLATYKLPQLRYTYIGFNLKHPLLSQLAFRQALALAINKDAIVASVLKGYGQPAELPQSPYAWSYPKTAKALYPYNPTESKKHLKTLGFVFNPKSGYFEKNGKPIELTLITAKDNKRSEKTAEIVQQFFKNVGVKLNIQLLEWQSFLKIITAPQDPKGYDLCMLSWSLNIDPDAYDVWHSSQYPAGFNFVAYHNPSVDQLLEQGRLTVEPEKRKVIYKKAYTQIASDLPYVFLFYPDALSAVSKQLSGLSKPGPAGLFVHLENIEKR
ncbi:MAG: peptide-binding protein [Candidatus Margulisiibacteriota bacterium]